MKTLKIIVFFLLALVYVPAYLLLHYTFNWWTNLLE